MSGLADWLKDFRALHALARAGKLAGRDADAYRSGRDELARALLAAQRLTLRAGEAPRQALRVARALQVDLDMLTSAARALTVDVSSGGFACLLAKAPPPGDEVKVSLRLPGGETLACRARVTDVKPLQGNVRAAFQFVGLTPAERERIELLVFDTVLEQLTA